MFFTKQRSLISCLTNCDSTVKPSVKYVQKPHLNKGAHIFILGTSAVIKIRHQAYAQGITMHIRIYIRSMYSGCILMHQTNWGLNFITHTIAGLKLDSG